MVTSSGMVSDLAQSAPSVDLPNTSDLCVENALDLSKKDTSVMDQGSEILDLSLRNSKADIVTLDSQVNRKEPSVSREQKEASETLTLLKSPVRLHEVSTFPVPAFNVTITLKTNCFAVMLLLGFFL